ncbi:hypothetical protein KTE96_04340 [Burkholderia multivorans]|uniref:hypothetical protein n=1 Tax=Burkholderia multivorans TaxID=87883 RepID=UPI001C24E975|nr:hypothetical protein [Burkholderia multivorans]MBU9610952.1 hypothetical protein [Burkholderia multivorans]
MPQAVRGRIRAIAVRDRACAASGRVARRARRICRAGTVRALVQANPPDWPYLRKNGLPTLSSTDRRIEASALDRPEENDQETGMTNRQSAACARAADARPATVSRIAAGAPCGVAAATVSED